MRVSFVSDGLETVHLYPSEVAAMEMYDETHANIEQGSDEKDIDDVIADKANTGDFQSYMPSSLSDLSGTLERERSAIAKQSRKSTEMEAADKEASTLSSYAQDGALFTESSTNGANALLF